MWRGHYLMTASSLPSHSAASSSGSRRSSGCSCSTLAAEVAPAAAATIAFLLIAAGALDRGRPTAESPPAACPKGQVKLQLLKLDGVHEEGVLLELASRRALDLRCQ